VPFEARDDIDAEDAQALGADVTVDASLAAVELAQTLGQAGWALPVAWTPRLGA
jgi:hypothetical protein